MCIFCVQKGNVSDGNDDALVGPQIVYGQPTRVRARQGIRPEVARMERRARHGTHLACQGPPSGTMAAERPTR